jgi:hypothetical protein
MTIKPKSVISTITKNITGNDWRVLKRLLKPTRILKK